MTAFSAYCPVANMGEVNRILSDAGYGPSNFSVPLRSGIDAATHAGLHTWGPQAFRDALAALSHLGVTIRDDGDDEPVTAFAKLATDNALEWSDPSDWFENPVMTDDERTHGGKTWRSLIDNNVWMPPVGWREVGVQPDWVQPTGAHDAYPQGFEVTHDAQAWVSDIAANVWEPGVFGWSLIEAPDQTEWAPGQTVSPGDIRTYQGVTYSCIQGHTTQVGWEPPRVPALWAVE